MYWGKKTEEPVHIKTFLQQKNDVKSQSQCISHSFMLIQWHCILIETKMCEFNLAEGLLYTDMSVQIDPLSRTYRACFAILSM